MIKNKEQFGLARKNSYLNACEKEKENAGWVETFLEWDHPSAGFASWLFRYIAFLLFLWGLKFNLVVPPFQPVLLLGRCDSSLPPTYRFCVEEWSE